MSLANRRATGQTAAVDSPTLYLVCGLPGAGKTTRSQQIVERMAAIHLCADEWVLGLGMSLVDFEFRVRLQECLLAHAANLLRAKSSVVVEFGSWSAEERETIRRVAVSEGAAAELHFLKAPLDELVRRVRTRGGPYAEASRPTCCCGMRASSRTLRPAKSPRSTGTSAPMTLGSPPKCVESQQFGLNRYAAR